MQCQATLDSFELHTKGIFNRITVIYKADEEYKQGYEMLKARRPFVEFKEEKDFRQDVLESMEFDYTCFAADDDICYMDFNKGIFRVFNDDVCCFSLRLGLNIDYCYSNDKPNKIKNYSEDGEYIKWDWRKEELDFGYPLSVVSHIFRTKDIRAWTDQIDFRNPNEYEGMLQTLLNQAQPIMYAYKKSRIVGVPANRVNTVTQNRHGLAHPYTTRELNQMYLDGKTIDITTKYDIHAAQQEVEYKFK